MTWIETIGDDDADAELQSLFEKTRDPSHGKLDAIMRIHSLHPRGLEAHFSLYQTVMRGTPTFRKVDREMVALVVSRINQCHY